MRFIGVTLYRPGDIAKMVKQLAKHGPLDFCYEAGRAVPQTYAR